MWIRLLAVLATSKSYGPLLRMIKLMIADMVKFNFIFFILIFSFASFCTALLEDSTTLGHYDSFDLSFRTLYSSALGIFNLEVFSENRELGEVLLGTFLVLSHVLMLHLLISILSNVYE